MPKIDVYDINGKKVKELELNENVFGIEPNEAVVHSVLINFLANQKQEVKFLVVERNHGDKKEQVEQDKEVLELHNGLKVV